MRWLLVILCVLAAPAAAEGLRGRQAPVERPPAPAQMSPIPPAPPATPAAVAVAGDPAQCRLRCAQGYYLCLAADDVEACSPSWNQCRASCEGPSFSVGRVGRR